MAENEKIIGIDIGSTKIVSSYCNSNGHALILTDDQSNRFMINCIGFTDRQRLFGFGAQCQASTNPKNTIFGTDLKLLHESSVEFCPLRKIQDRNKVPVIVVDYRNKMENIYPEQLLAMMLAKVKENAEKSFQSNVKSCVVTIPSCYTMQQRISVEDACKIAGFTNIHIINDTTAGAITYAVLKKHTIENQNVLIFDIGATKTEASIAFINHQSVLIKANSGEINIGGDNFVRTLISHFIREFKSETKVNLATDDQAIARLRFGCEKLKKALSTNDTAKVTLESFYDEKSYDLIMTRQIFELMCADHFRKIIDVGRRLFQSTLIPKSDIAATILIGGGGRIPKIQEDLKAFMHGMEISRVLNQDEAIATGAAYYTTCGLRIEEQTRPSSLFGDRSGLNIPEMQQLLQRLDDEESALVDYMAQVNDLEKLCYSYKRAITKQGVSQEDAEMVKQKCNQTLAWLEVAQINNFDRNDFRRKSKELKETYAFACNKKDQGNEVFANGFAPTKVEPSIQPTVQPTVKPPVQPNVEHPVQPTVKPPVQPNVEHPVQPNVEHPVQPIVKPPVQPFIEPPFPPIKETKVQPIKETIAQPSKQELLDRGIAHFTSENYKEACEVFSLFIRTSKQQSLPENVSIYDIYLYRAQCYFHLQNYEKAIEDIKKVPRDQRPFNIKNLYDQALRKVYITRAERTLREIKMYQKDAQAATIALDKLTKILGEHPTPVTFEEIRLTSNLLHQRAILNFQMRYFDQAIKDAYRNSNLIHGNPDFKEVRDHMYDDLKQYLRTIPKNQLNRMYGAQTCQELHMVEAYIADSQRRRKNNTMCYCC